VVVGFHDPDLDVLSAFAQTRDRIEHKFRMAECIYRHMSSAVGEIFDCSNRISDIPRIDDHVSAKRCCEVEFLVRNIDCDRPELRDLSRS
jgi:hypothetical protein